MPRGDKSSYTDKQKRKAQHIEESYEKRGVPAKEAAARAYATVNKDSGGGNKSGSGRGKPDTNASARKGGRIGGRKAASKKKTTKKSPAKKSAGTRKRSATKRKSAVKKGATKRKGGRRKAGRKKAARKTR